jgi:hypothetical protein
MDLSATDLILTLNEQEVQAFLGLIDVAVKAQGLNGVINAAVLYQKIQTAAKEQAKPKAE